MIITGNVVGSRGAKRGNRTLKPLLVLEPESSALGNIVRVNIESRRQKTSQNIAGKQRNGEAIPYLRGHQ